jgi:Tfp pilus assembly protein PilO
MKYPEKQQLIIAVSAVAIIAGFCVFRYFPAKRQSLALKQAKADSQSRAAANSARAGQIPQLREKLQKMHDRIGNYDVKIPGGRNFAQLFEQIASVMNECSLGDQMVQPKEEIVGDKLNCIPISIKCKGSLEQIFKLFGSLNDFDRLINITNLQLTGDKDYSGIVEMSAEANVYYHPTEENNG